VKADFLPNDKNQLKIANFDTLPFVDFLFRMALSTRQKMWTKNSLDSEGAYSLSCEILSTIRQMYELNADPESTNYAWNKGIDIVLQSLFKDGNLKRFSIEASVELETLMSIIRGCEYLGMLPFAKAKLIQDDLG